MEIRDLTTADVFAMVRIFSKMQVKPYLKEFAEKVSEMNTKNKKYIDGGKKDDALLNDVEAISTELGFFVPIVVMENYEKAEKEIQKLLASLCGASEKEFMADSAETLIDLIAELKGNEKFNMVFMKALKLFGK